jgi:serine acetyltransferase
LFKVFRDLKADYSRISKSKQVLMVLTIYRTGNYIYYSKLPKVMRKLLLVPIKILQILCIELTYNITIPFPAKIGKGLRLTHLSGIVIHPSVEIGENCTILQQVTIGANEHRADYREAAKIKDNVYIGAGAKIIGNITIEENVKIGANAVVYRNVPSDCTVVGDCKITKSKSVENRRYGVI